MQKKLPALFLAVLLAASFAGCAGNKESTEASASEKNDVQGVEAILNEKAEQYKDHEDPVAVIVMDSGDCIVMELYKDVAPQTVKNFISLANKGFYDGLTFHRIDPTFMIQGGDPEGNGSGGPGYEIFGEFSNNGFRNDLSHERGVVSMARRGSQTNPEQMYNTAGSQFFICVKDSTFLDGDYAAFGRVLEGMETVDEIANAEGAGPRGETPVNPRVMQLVRVTQGGVTVKD